MFFFWSKIAGVLTNPTSLAIGLVALTALLAWTRYARSAYVLMTSGAILLVLLAFSPLQALMVLPLENRFPEAPSDLPAPTGIIVLGGSTDGDIEAARGQVALNGAAARLTTGAALARKYPNARLVFTGGSAALTGQAPSEASSVRRLWIELGVPQDNVAYEDKSRNTWENALYTRDLVKPTPDEKWLLVTSAMHMPRSMGLFRHVGFSVIAYPTDYKSFGNSWDWMPSADPAKSMGNIEIATHEWIGLLVYWLTGKTDSLFPKPNR